jgi:tRNA C32,U32 (ribose-2'-O)-methylase TrmJ
VSPEEGVDRLTDGRGPWPVALVLGRRAAGLSDEELALCQDVACIPAPGPQPSLNVAQAAR